VVQQDVRGTVVHSSGSAYYPVKSGWLSGDVHTNFVDRIHSAGRTCTPRVQGLKVSILTLASVWLRCLTDKSSHPSHPWNER
jgi:hypothetical protein